MDSPRPSCGLFCRHASLRTWAAVRRSCLTGPAITPFQLPPRRSFGPCDVGFPTEDDVAEERGGSVRLVGDDQQLVPVDKGHEGRSGDRCTLGSRGGRRGQTERLARPVDSPRPSCGPYIARAESIASSEQPAASVRRSAGLVEGNHLHRILGGWRSRRRRMMSPTSVTTAPIALGSSGGPSGDFQ